MIFLLISGDFSVENDQNFRMSTYLKCKPPLPVRKQNYLTQSTPSEVNRLKDETELAENCENTMDSIRLNESDLKDLEDEFTFEEEDEEVKQVQNELQVSPHQVGIKPVPDFTFNTISVLPHSQNNNYTFNQTRK